MGSIDAIEAERVEVVVVGAGMSDFPQLHLYPTYINCPDS